MDYLKKVLGIQVVYRSSVPAHFPNFIRTRYELTSVTLDGIAAIFLSPKTELDELETLKKHLARVKKAVACPVVLVLQQITFRQKEALLREKIPFVVEGKQIYLPFLAVYLQERCDAEKQPRKEILPSAQMLLLYFIYHGAKDLPTSQAAKDLKLTPTSISRASRQLEELNLIQTKKIGVQKFLLSDRSPKELFQTAKSSLVDPVKRTVYIPKNDLGPKPIRSGYSALAEYSMLNPPLVACYAAESISPWKSVWTNQLQDSQTQAAVQLWRYDPRKLTAQNTVDILSLALSLTNDADERVEEAVKEMMNDLWRNIDGYRN